jgi:serine/threonine-protein kinase
MSDCPVRVGDLLAGKYRVERVLGQGGMGVVVAAWHIELEQRVAVKFLLPQFATDLGASERFRREARAAVKLKNQHVARVIDVGTMDDDAPYMVMEFLDGHDLQSEMETQGCFGVEVGVEFVLQACLAMSEAHAKGLIHRDLKPANLFRTTGTDGSNLVKVLDFGISKSMTGSGSNGQLSLTRTAAMMGSPLYMSPEQLESARDVDERTDIWSLGVILFELVTGCVPFTGDSLPQLVRSVLQGKFPAAHELQPGIPEGLSEVIARCLRHDKFERFANVAELASALAPYCTQGEAYAERVRRVLQVSALPSAAHTPLQLPASGTQPVDRGSLVDLGSAAREASDSGGSAVAVVSVASSGSASSAGRSTGKAGVARAPNTVEVQFDEADPGVELGGETRVDGGAALTGHTVGEWGTTSRGRSTPRSDSRRLQVMAVAAALVGVGAIGWFGLRFGDPDGQAAGEAASPEEAPVVVAGQPSAQDLGLALVGEGREPSRLPDTPDTGSGVSVTTVDSAAAASPATDPADLPASSSKPAATAPSVAPAASEEVNPVTSQPQASPRKPAAKPRPKPAPPPEKKPGGITDFGGRR